MDRILEKKDKRCPDTSASFAVLLPDSLMPLDSKDLMAKYVPYKSESDRHKQVKADSDTEKLYQSVHDAVVKIEARRGAHKEQSSGFFIADMEIMTAAHCVQGKQIAIKTSKGEILSGAIVALDTEHDLAIVNLQESPKEHYPRLTFAKSENLGWHESIYAIGYALGLSPLFIAPGSACGTHSLADGLKTSYWGESLAANAFASGTEKNISPAVLFDRGVILNGMSGGPILDRFGQVVGVASGYFQSLRFFESPSGMPYHGHAALSEYAIKLLSQLHGQTNATAQIPASGR